MSALDKLLKPKGWSSKKFAGLTSLAMAFILAVLSLDILVIGLFLGYSASCFGIDAYNKKTKSNQNV